MGTQVIKYVRAFGEREKAGSETPRRVLFATGTDPLVHGVRWN